MPTLKPYFKSDIIEAGCDEAGRGCLAGPVYAAAVILPSDYSNKLLNDSKKLSEKQRYLLRPEIEREAIAFAVASVDNIEIDEINILNASFKAMHQAIAKLLVRPQHLIIDGNRFKPFEDIIHTCVIQGDGKYLSIAAASILAKTYRDDFMMEIDKQYPVYNWKKNKAYGTFEHMNAILENGVSPYHRKSFNLIPSQLKLSL